jgi:hypothetical protein
MTATKIVKMVYDGQGYWLLWHWEMVPLLDAHPTDERLSVLSGHMLYGSGPYGSKEDARKAVAADWMLIPFQSAE